VWSYWSHGLTEGEWKWVTLVSGVYAAVIGSSLQFGTAFQRAETYQGGALEGPVT